MFKEIMARLGGKADAAKGKTSAGTEHAPEEKKMAKIVPYKGNAKAFILTLDDTPGLQEELDKKKREQGTQTDVEKSKTMSPKESLRDPFSGGSIVPKGASSAEMMSIIEDRQFDKLDATLAWLDAHPEDDILEEAESALVERAEKKIDALVKPTESNEANAVPPSDCTEDPEAAWRRKWKGWCPMSEDKKPASAVLRFQNNSPALHNSQAIYLDEETGDLCFDTDDFGTMVVNVYGSKRRASWLRISRSVFEKLVPELVKDLFEHEQGFIKWLDERKIPYSIHSDQSDRVKDVPPVNREEDICF